MLLSKPVLTSIRMLFGKFLARKSIHKNRFEIVLEDVVVDIGAHIMIFSVYAGKKAYNGFVLSYGPFPKNFKLLKENNYH